MSRKAPKYRFHRSTNRAVVTLNGREIYLRRYDSPESHAEYDRLISEWRANGRMTPHRSRRFADHYKT